MKYLNWTTGFYAGAAGLLVGAWFHLVLTTLAAAGLAVYAYQRSRSEY